MRPNDVLQFWFDELTPADWFAKSDALDGQIMSRFSSLLSACAAGECWQWREADAAGKGTGGLGRLAEILVLDQFSRNVYRDDARAFAQDPMALALAQEAVALGVDSSMSAQQRAFLYMPYMHSESLVVHDEAMRLFNQPGLETNYEFEIKHREIIERFGRYPHRNALLGRASTSAELEFLQQPGSSF
ncbi:DUF924 family protein [Pseudidiomarina homiensis]|uniref:DUF924 domain-containing protein n=1 Tax=Pseudidiomarina homiensis TaxID=364198 RepID=A0A432Y3H3_9GAMM|nr:DUF924 family protein [Pseudidiomarina homiensis]RUO55520.1 DUF924 domain-containing protein [Pseudidiomarina homiensis]